MTVNLNSSYLFASCSRFSRCAWATYYICKDDSHQAEKFLIVLILFRTIWKKYIFTLNSFPGTCIWLGMMVRRNTPSWLNDEKAGLAHVRKFENEQRNMKTINRLPSLTKTAFENGRSSKKSSWAGKNNKDEASFVGFAQREKLLWSVTRGI